MPKPLFLSLAPNAINENGHDIIYQKHLAASAKTLSFNYFALFSNRLEIRPLQKNWRLFFRAQKLLKLLDFCKAFLIKREKILFIESFNTTDFILLTIATLFCSSKRDRLWILFRYGFHQLRNNGLIHRSLSRLCKTRLGSRFAMFTDSELIAKDYAPFPMTVLPIPHTSFHVDPAEKQGKPIYWWPGPPREAKGWKEILQLASQNFSNCELVAAEKSNLPNATLIPDILSREEYLQWLGKADVILLPYDPQVYKSSTSGIFIEAVIAGKWPIVKEGSWLANELKKHHLSELIMEWDSPTFFSDLQLRIQHPVVIKKFEQMRKSYLAFHSQERFTASLKNRLDSAQSDVLRSPAS